MTFALVTVLIASQCAAAVSQAPQSPPNRSSAFLQRAATDARRLTYDFWSFNPYINTYEKVAGVGGWGGKCTCPNGEEYEVGDNDDSCGSLACVGGVPGGCDKNFKSERNGMRATCGNPSDFQPGWTATLNTNLHQCDEYLFERGCEWTLKTGCPGQFSGTGEFTRLANEEKFGKGTPMDCCCDKELWRWERENKESRTDCTHDANCGAFQICLHSKCYEWPSNGGRRPGNSCSHDADCINWRCVANTCSGAGPGDKCHTDSDCTNDRCVEGYCRTGNNGDPCEGDSDCNSGSCRGKKPVMLAVKERVCKDP